MPRRPGKQFDARIFDNRRGAANVRHRSGIGSSGDADNVRGGREARARHDERVRTPDGSGKLAAIDGPAPRTTSRAAQGLDRSTVAPASRWNPALEIGYAGPTSGAFVRSATE